MWGNVFSTAVVRAVTPTDRARTDMLRYKGMTETNIMFILN